MNLQRFCGLLRSRWTRWLANSTCTAALASGAVIALLWWQQATPLFQPKTLPAEHRFDIGSDVRKNRVAVPGARLNALHLHLRLPKPDGVVFFLHGKAGSLTSWFLNVDFYRRLNFDPYIIDFRGYGKSSATSKAKRR